MDFFDGHNYKINKILLSAIGQWPYQSSRTSHTIIVVIATVACSQFVAKLCGMFSYIHDMNILIECLIPIMIDISGITKVTNSMLYVDEIKALLDRIRADFRSLSNNSSDTEILRKYANNGKKFSTIYICTMYALTIVFMLMPLQPLILRVHNASTTRPLLHKVEYYIDMDRYYFPILIHGYLTVIICVTSIVATDALFIMLVQHVCGLFIIIGSRIDRSIQERHSSGVTDPPITIDKTYQNMMQCIYDHKAALSSIVEFVRLHEICCILIDIFKSRFVALMEIAYSKHFLFIAGLNMVAMSITAVGALAKLDDPSELLRLIAVSWALLFHLCFECLNAQRLMDHSEYLHTNLINLKWYDTSSRTKRLVLFMMMRTQPPCVLTAGGMFVLCMETFATIVKTAVSYFTFLRSAQ